VDLRQSGRLILDGRKIDPEIAEGWKVFGGDRADHGKVLLSRRSQECNPNRVTANRHFWKSKRRPSLAAGLEGVCGKST
jgi:hypothetical protein